MECWNIGITFKTHNFSVMRYHTETQYSSIPSFHHSNSFFNPQSFLFHVREKYDLANGDCIGEQHHQPIDADTLASRGRHTILQSFDIIFIHQMRLLIAFLTAFNLLDESRFLINGVIELGKTVGNLATGNKKLKAFGYIRLLIAATGKR